MEALAASRWPGYAGYVSLQPYYNLVDRGDFERELEPLCLAHGIGVIPYSPLAKGFLTGKYRRDGPLPDSIRAGGVRQRYMHERGWAILDAVVQVAQQRDASPAQVALAWLLQRPAVAAPIVGASSITQLQDTMGATELDLSAHDVALLDEVSAW
jgi:aryl-alcohol dehydrogenase-like predicted oxidoreductase